MGLSREQIGLLVTGAGVALALVGLLIWTGAFKWFGHLPGDVRIDSDKVHVYFPLVSMLVVSVVLSLVVHLVRRILS